MKWCTKRKTKNFGFNALTVFAQMTYWNALERFLFCIKFGIILNFCPQIILNALMRLQSKDN